MSDCLCRKAITTGYFHQAARVKGIGEFVNIRSGLPTHLHPTSALYGLGCKMSLVKDHHVRMTDLFFPHRYAFVCHLSRANFDVEGIYDASHGDRSILAW